MGKYALILACIFVAVGAAANPEEYGKPKQEFVKGFDDYLKYLPENQRKAFKDYLALAGNIHGGASESIEARNQRLVSGKCYSQIAAKYLTWVMADDLRLLKSNGVKIMNSSLTGKISLAEEAGKGMYANRKPGFLWEKALEFSGGNADIAISLIGLCGHDDSIGADIKISTSSPAYKETREATTANFTAMLDELEKIKPSLSSKVQSSYPDAIAHYQKIMERPEATLKCMPWSINYLPKALGKDVDIDDKLKARIVRTQAPIKGAESIPAKGYHFNGSALMACAFKNSSAIGTSAILANPMAARVYRGMRLVTDRGLNKGTYVRMLPADAKDIDEKLLQSLRTKYASLPKCKWKTSGLVGSSSEILAQPGEKNASICASAFEKAGTESLVLVSQFEQCAQKVDSEDLGKIKTCLLRRIENEDAALLASKWFEWIEIPGIGDVAFPSRSKRPEYRQLQQGAVAGFASPTLLKVADRCEEKGWTKDRCDRAIEIVESWETDFAWTQTQHFEGSKFAVEKCSTLKPNESLEDLACKALGQKPAGAAGTSAQWSA